MAAIGSVGPLGLLLPKVPATADLLGTDLYLGSHQSPAIQAGFYYRRLPTLWIRSPSYRP